MLKMDRNAMAQCILILYNFVLLVTVWMVGFFFSIMITILYILFRRNQNKTDLEKEETETQEWTP
jgi:preprotein translocase subunit SecG